MAHSSLVDMPYISHQMSAQYETRELDLRYSPQVPSIVSSDKLDSSGCLPIVAPAWLHKQYPNIPSLEAMSICNRVGRVESHLRAEIPDLCKVTSLAVAKGVQRQHEVLS